MFDPFANTPRPNRSLIYFGACIISGLRLAREKQVNIRVMGMELARAFLESCGAAVAKIEDDDDTALRFAFNARWRSFVQHRNDCDKVQRSLDQPGECLMCGRYVRRSDKQRIAEEFRARNDVSSLALPPADYNVARSLHLPAGYPGEPGRRLTRDGSHALGLGPVLHQIAL